MPVQLPGVRRNRDAVDGPANIASESCADIHIGKGHRRFPARHGTIFASVIEAHFPSNFKNLLLSSFLHSLLFFANLLPSLFFASC